MKGTGDDVSGQMYNPESKQESCKRSLIEVQSSVKSVSCLQFGSCLYFWPFSLSAGLPDEHGDIV